MRLACARRHYSQRTARTYVFWARRYILFHGKRHPRELGADGLTAFLNHLAGVACVSASTQSQALNTLICLYRHVLGSEPGWLEKLERVKRKQFLPIWTLVGRALLPVESPNRGLHSRTGRSTCLDSTVAVAICRLE